MAKIKVSEIRVGDTVVFERWGRMTITDAQASGPRARKITGADNQYVIVNEPDVDEVGLESRDAHVGDVLYREGDTQHWGVLHVDGHHANVMEAVHGYRRYADLRQGWRHLNTGVPVAVRAAAPQSADFDGTHNEVFRFSMPAVPTAGWVVGKLTGTAADLQHPEAPPTKSPYDARTNALADECGRLQSDLDNVLKENALLRRRVEMLERKVKR